MGNSYKRKPARDVAQDRGEGNFWIDHAEIVDADLGWLHSAERLTLWNVTLPPGFLAKLTKLWWLDIRGGSSADLGAIRDAVALRYLCINQVRGLSDLSLAAELHELEYLDLYGLPKVAELPSFRNSHKLEHAKLGQLRGLTSLAGVLDAPALRELELAKKIAVTPADIARIRRHPRLQQFSWFPEDVPDKVWTPVVTAIELAPLEHLHAEEWFAMRRGIGS